MQFPNSPENAPGGRGWGGQQEGLMISARITYPVLSQKNFQTFSRALLCCLKMLMFDGNAVSHVMLKSFILWWFSTLHSELHSACSGWWI